MNQNILTGHRAMRNAANNATRLRNNVGRKLRNPAASILSRLEAGDPSVADEGFPFVSVTNGQIVLSPITTDAHFTGRELVESILYSRIHTPATPVSKTIVVDATGSATIAIGLADVQASDPSLTAMFYPFVDVRMALPPLTTGPISNIKIDFAADGMPTQHCGSAWPSNPGTSVAQLDVGEAVEVQFVPYVMRRAMPHLVMGNISGSKAVQISVSNLPAGTQITLTLPGVDHYTIAQAMTAALARL